MRCSSDLVGRSRSLAQLRTCCLVPSPRSSARSSSGAPTIIALSWLMALTLARQALWRVASSTCSACRSPRRRGVTRWSQARASRAARRASRASLLAPVRRRSLGPPDLDHPLAEGLQEGGQPRAVAAGALDRPAAPTRHLRLSEVEQGLVAGQVGSRRGLPQGPAYPIGGCGGEGVAVGVHPDHPVDGVGQPGHRSRSPFPWALGRVGLETPRGASVTGHNPRRLDRLLIRPASGVPGRRRHPRQTARNLWRLQERRGWWG